MKRLGVMTSDDKEMNVYISPKVVNHDLCSVLEFVSGCTWVAVKLCCEVKMFITLTYLSFSALKSTVMQCGCLL